MSGNTNAYVIDKVGAKRGHVFPVDSNFLPGFSVSGESLLSGMLAPRSRDSLVTAECQVLGVLNNVSEGWLCDLTASLSDFAGEIALLNFLEFSVLESQTRQAQELCCRECFLLSSTGMASSSHYLSFSSDALTSQ